MQDECQLTDFFCSGCSPDILCEFLAPFHPGRTSKLLNTETGRVIRAPRIGEKFNGFQGFQYTQFTDSQVFMDDPTCDILFNGDSSIVWHSCFAFTSFKTRLMCRFARDTGVVSRACASALTRFNWHVTVVSNALRVVDVVSGNFAPALAVPAFFGLVPPAVA